MAINTNSELQSTVASFLQRDDLTLQIPVFIELATARFSDELRTPEMEAVATTTLANEWTALPSDFRAVRLMEVDGKVVEYATPFQIQRMVQNKARPENAVYTIQDMMFRIFPFPTSGVAELTYYAALPALTQANDTNWLLVKRPDVYLHATLAQARLFLHDDQRVVMAQQFTDKFIEEANRRARQLAHGSTPLSVKVA